MKGELYQTPSGLFVAEEKLARMEHALSYDGPGAFRVPDVLEPSFHQSLLDEIADPARVVWRDAGETYANARGVIVEQNHDTFALKLSAGDPEPVAQVPIMRQLAYQTEDFIRSLAGRYPSLGGWQADEMSYHRYYKETGLTFHRDNRRFPGLIAVIVIDGASDFQIVDRTPLTRSYDHRRQQKIVTEWDVHSTYTIPTTPGDMILTRASGLLPDMQPTDLPEHAVMNGRVLPRISFMLRANLRPTDTSYGFDYHNWPAKS